MWITDASILRLARALLSGELQVALVFVTDGETTTVSAGHDVRVLRRLAVELVRLHARVDQLELELLRGRAPG